MLIDHLLVFLICLSCSIWLCWNMFDCGCEDERRRWMTASMLGKDLQIGPIRFAVLLLADDEMDETMAQIKKHADPEVRPDLPSVA